MIATEVVLLFVMFCPRCGTSEQAIETFCRKCGLFLPDLDKIAKRETPVEQHLLINSTFSVMTAVASLSLAVTLYAMFIGREGTHWILYVVFGFLISITAWQVQTFVRTRMLKKQFERMRPKVDDPFGADRLVRPADTSRLLADADFGNVVPASITDRTTKNLSPKSDQ